MSAYDYPDPGLDPEYCDGLSARYEDEDLDLANQQTVQISGPFERQFAHATARLCRPDTLLIVDLHTREVRDVLGPQDWMEARILDRGMVVITYRKRA